MPILELCAGYGGLAKAVEAITGDETTHVAEVHPAACKILDERFPNVPNLGNMWTFDWKGGRAGKLAEIDIISCGFP